MMRTPATMRFFMRPVAISLASVVSLRKHAMLTVLSTVDVSSLTRATRRSCSAACTRHDAMIENSSPMTTASSRIERLVRATMLRGTSAASTLRAAPPGLSGLDFKHHLHVGVDRRAIDIRDRVGVALYELDGGLRVRHLERRGGLAREHQSRPVRTDFRRTLLYEQL